MSTRVLVRKPYAFAVAHCIPASTEMFNGEIINSGYQCTVSTTDTR